MSKELINEIESKIAWNDKSINETSISLKDVKRLLNELEEQAERVEELEEEIENWRKVKEATVKLLGENKRYKKALENITISPIPLEIDDAVNIARQALKGDDD